MLIILLIALFILAIIYILAIIKMAKQRRFFRVIIIHLIIFVSYLYIALHFERLFDIRETFGYQKLEFLVACMFIQIVIGFYLVKNTDKKLLASKEIKEVKKENKNDDVL